VLLSAWPPWRWPSLQHLAEIPLRCEMSDPFSHIVVGSADPTAYLSRKDSNYRECWFEWWDDTLPTLVLRWQCTRESGHAGHHLAGTGYSVAAVHSPEKPIPVGTDSSTAQLGP
jgi:hypothetical protein